MQALSLGLRAPYRLKRWVTLLAQASLRLDFTKGGPLDSRVTFTRASGGTSFRPVGRGALVNQLLWSGDFSNAAWTKSELALTANQPGPSGAGDAVLLTETAVSGVHQLFVTYTPPSVGQVTFAATVKRAGKDLSGFGGNWEFSAVQVNLQTGAVSGAGSSSVTVADAGNGYWVIARVGTLPDTISRTYVTRTSDSGATAGSGILLHRAALFQGTVTAQQILDNGGIPLTFTSADNLLRLDAPGDPIQLFTAPANMPRMDYDPVTRQCKGLLIEEQRTNALLWSSNFANAAWTKMGCTVAVSSVLAPDGSPMTLLTENTSTGAHYVLQSVVSGAGRATQSWYVKPNGRTRIQVRSESPQTNQLAASFLLTGNGSVTAGAGTISLLANGIYFVTVASSGNGTGTSGYHLIQTLDAAGAESYAGDNTSGIYIWGAQLEAGAFATSHVPTTGAAATRAADTAVVATLAPWYNASAGTLFAEAVNNRVPSSDSFVRFAAALYDTTSYQNAVRLELLSGLWRDVNTVAGVSSAPAGAWTQGVVGKIAAAFGPTGNSASFNGSTPVAAGSSVPTGITKLTIGGNEGGSNMFSGHIRRVAFWPRRMSNLDLQGLTR